MKVFNKISILLLSISCLLGCSSSTNNSTSKRNTVNESTQQPQSIPTLESSVIAGSSCNWKIWEEANARCLGDAGCAGRTYREMSGGDITGGIDCVTSAYKRKMKSMGIDLEKISVPKNSKEIRWSVLFPDYFKKKAQELLGKKGQELIVIELGNKILELAEKPIDKYSGYYFIGYAKDDLKDYQGALKAYDQGLGVELPNDKTNCQLNKLKAITYGRMDKIDLAIKERLVSIEKCKDNKELVYNGYLFITRKYLRREDWENTIYYADKALEAKPYLIAQMLRADAYLKLGNYKEYCKDYQTMASRYKKAINDASWGYNENPRSEKLDKYFDEAANVCGDFF